MRATSRRASSRLAFLFPAVLLVGACGGVPSEEPSVESLGVSSQALVEPYIDVSASSNCGYVSAGGNWWVGDPEGRHGGARIELLLGGVVQVSQDYTSDGGTWSLGFRATSCLSGSNTLEARITPLNVSDGAPFSRTATFVNGSSCGTPTASVSCSRPYPYTQVVCTGSGSGGNGPLTPMWREGITVWDTGEVMYSDWWEGSWSDNYGCASASTRDSNQLRIQFKVRDCSGVESPVANGGLYYCR